MGPKASWIVHGWFVGIVVLAKQSPMVRLTMCFCMGILNMVGTDNIVQTPAGSTPWRVVAASER